MILLPSLQYRATNERRAAQSMACFHFLFYCQKLDLLVNLILTISFYGLRERNLNLWRACIILRWKWIPGRLFCYVRCLFPVGNFKQKCSEALSHICRKSSVSTNHHMWFMDHSSIYGRLDPFRMPHAYVFSSQERWFFQDYSPSSKWKHKLSPTLEKESGQREILLISGPLHSPQANTMYPPA